mmetsp:Transcript_5727/g.13045  ORF Transcript_5727/g.13045 Transcript_5727/m.13045 type:complete len:315 (-) Transcript_5727:310-1254(-)
MGHQDLVSRHADFCLVHHKPFTSPPVVLMPLILGSLERALHAHHGLGILAHGEFFQMVVRLKHDLSHACASQPAGLEALHLPEVFGLAGQARGCILHVEGEQWLPAFFKPDTESKRQVLKVHACRRVDGWDGAHGAGCIVQDESAHALCGQVAPQNISRHLVARHHFHPPADVVLGALLLLQGSVPAHASLIIFFCFLEKDLGLALTVKNLVPIIVPQVADGETALGTEVHLLAVGVHHHVWVLLLHGALHEALGDAHCVGLRGQGIEVVRSWFARSVGLVREEGAEQLAGLFDLPTLLLLRRAPPDDLRLVSI